jgi:hypothetical protein
MPSKYGDKIPHIERIDGWDVWVIHGEPFARPGITAMAGYDGTLPDSPETYGDMHPAARDPKARVAFMDEQNIRAHVLYPNLGAPVAPRRSFRYARGLLAHCLRGIAGGRKCTTVNK